MGGAGLGRVLQHFALGGGVQQVGVDRKRRLALLVLGDRDLMLPRELQQLLAALEGPLPPGRHDPDRRVQRIIGQLEADLVVALAGRAVRHRVGADLLGDLDLLLGDQRAGDRGAEQVDALVERVRPEHREHVVADEFLAQVLDENVALLDTQHQRLAAGRLQLLALAEVGREGDHLRLVGLLQPLQDDRGVEAARVGEHHLFHLALGAFGRHAMPLFARGNARGAL